MVFYTRRSATQAHLQSSNLGHLVCIWWGPHPGTPKLEEKSGVGKVGESEHVLGPEQCFLSKYMKRMASGGSRNDNAFTRYH